LRYNRDPLNPLNGDALVITDLSGHRRVAGYVCFSLSM